MSPRKSARRRVPHRRQWASPEEPVAAPAPAPTVGSPSLVPIGLAAIVLGVPLAVLPWTTGPYDDPKAWALPIVVGLTGVLWVVDARRAATPRPADRAVRRLGWLVLIVIAWWVFTSIVSVAPAQSVLGGFGRGTGLLVVGSAALLFFLVQSDARTASGVRALVDVTLLGSVPVCLMALAQAKGWDPLPGVWDPAIVRMRVRSTLGSHIFLGSYLAMVVPLAAARLEWAWRERTGFRIWPSGRQQLSMLIGGLWTAGALSLIWLAGQWSLLWWALVPWGVVGALAWRWFAGRPEADPDTGLTVVFVGALLAAQVIVVLLSRGRGGFLGMLVGLLATVLGLLMKRRAWKTLALASIGVVGLVTFLVLLNTPGSPLARLARMPLLMRLAGMGDVRPGTPGWVRLQVWKGIGDGWRRHLLGEEVIPGESPRLRLAIGYGPETQLLVLEPVMTSFHGGVLARGGGWQARYVFDRSHNIVLDRLVTEGVIGVGLWALLVAGLLALGIARIRSSTDAGETAVRLGALGALLGHLADGQVGMETTTPIALFWVSAALLTVPSWTHRPETAPGRGHAWTSNKIVWSILLAVTVGGTVLVAWMGTRWLLASMAYADGTRHGIEGRLQQAHQEFRRAITLAPWLALPAEASAYTLLRLGGAETDPSRRLALYREGQATLEQARRYAMGGADSWALTGQLAFAEARAEGQRQFTVSRGAFAAALRLRPGDGQLIAQSGFVSLEGGDPAAGRAAALEALRRDSREWMAWALLARSAGQLGNATEADRASRMARTLAPPEAQRVLGALLPDLQRP
jgi:hypothetical protein